VTPGPLHGVPLGPGPRGVLVLVPVRLVHVRDLGDKRVVGVWIRQQGADGQQHLEPNTRPGKFEFIRIQEKKNAGVCRKVMLWKDNDC